jgi:hypothetical protein
VTSQPSDPPASGPTGTQHGPFAGGAPTEAPTTGPTGGEAKPADQFTRPLRQPAAFVLLAANGLILLFAVMDLFAIFENWANNFLIRADSSFNEFVGVVSIGFPLLAVLLATHLKPPVPQARLITVLALVEYGVSALFGVLCLLVSFLHGLMATGTTLGLSPIRSSVEEFVVRAGSLAVLAVAALAVFHVFQGVYAPVRPVSAAPYPPHGHPGYPQTGYPPPYGRPTGAPYGAPPQQSWAGPGRPGPAFGGGQPQQPSSYYPPQYAAPAQSGFAPPPAGQPSSESPAGRTPAADDADRTQAIPPPGGPDDANRTQAIPPPGGPEDADRTQAIPPPGGPDDPTQRWSRP